MNQRSGDGGFIVQHRELRRRAAWPVNEHQFFCQSCERLRKDTISSAELIQSVWWSLKDSWCRIKPRQRILSVVLAFLLLITLWPSQHVTQAPKIQDQSIAQLSPGEESRLQMLSQTTPGVVYVKGKPALGSQKRRIRVNLSLVAVLGSLIIAM